MKRRKLFGHIFFVIVVLLCCYAIYSVKSMEGRAKEYYTMEDFKDIKVGESTLYDVNRIAPTESLMLTSYGSMCEYPMEDGKHIYIKFYEGKLEVGEIGIEGSE